MGDPKRQRKKYSRPKHPWTVETLSEQLRLVGEYGLRNRKELWRAQSMLRQIRRLARSCQALRGEERVSKERGLLSKLYAMGLIDKDANVDDVLSLVASNFLDRRLQTVVLRKGLANTIHHARQLVVHGKILVADRAISVPGHMVSRKEEANISEVGAS